MLQEKVYSLQADEESKMRVSPIGKRLITEILALTRALDRKKRQ
jgi:hypothetical protein